MDFDELPAAGTCDLSTRGRRSGRVNRIEIWYVVIDGNIAITGTPGARDWLANLRADPTATLHLRDPDQDVDVVAEEITDPDGRRHFIDEAFRVQPWYAHQPFTRDEWLDSAPMVVFEPTRDRTGPTAS